ncbi:VWA domain-containing protein [Reinekea thalattae]|uniref:VWA domain-containing protein n=1 Tax=Reinekea thalattae TaxID=2593301 RepID=A0A5C8Z839_9GAMM|nr:VWA domain-containing protein [Reinekea thalattae]TXR54112.1 VWA domain-containing protein [Reinekea thalattae]
MSLLRPMFLMLLLIWWPLCFMLFKEQVLKSRWLNVMPAQLLKALTEASPKSTSNRYTLLLLGTLIILALSGPSIKQTDIESVSQGDLYVVLDNSLSMAATDTKPNRYSRAKWMIEDWAKSGIFDRTSVTLYAASAHLLTPLTHDSETLKTQLTPLTPYLMPKQGSAPEQAFELLKQQLAHQNSSAAHILWITDEIRSSQIDLIAKQLPSVASKTLVAVGDEQSVPIPMEGGQGYVTYGGSMVQVSTNHQAIAQAGKKLGFETVALGSLPNHSILNSIARANQPLALRVDVGYWLMLPILLLFLWQLRHNAKLLQFILLPCLLSSLLVEPASANLFQNSNQQAYQALNNNAAEQAIKKARDPEILAQALFDQQQYQAAADQFLQLKTADGYYNAGNALAHLGDLQAAISAYDQALAITDHAQAKANKKLIEDYLKQQESDQSQSNENNSGESQPSSNGESSSSSEQNSQQSDSSSADNQDNSGNNNQASSSEPGDTDEQSNASNNEQSGDSENQNESSSDDNNASNSSQAESTEQAQNNEATLSAEELQNRQQVDVILNQLPAEQDSLLRYKFQYQYQQNPNESEGNPW